MQHCRIIFACFGCIAVAALAAEPTTNASSRPASTRATTTATRPATKPTTRPLAVRPMPPANPPAAQAAKPPVPAGPELWEQIAQRRDPELRRVSFDKLRAMLGSQSTADQRIGLRTLQQIAEIRFDHAAFGASIRALLKSPDDEVRAAALQALTAYPMTQDDLTPIAAMAADRSPRVRANVAAALVAANARVGSTELDAAMLTLLDDADYNVRRESIRAIANIDAGDAVEKKLIDLSYDPKISREAIAQGVSTRPIIDGAIARRLIDLLDDADPQNVTRASWALRNATLEGADRAELDKALLRTLDDSLNVAVRESCVIALGHSPDPAIFQKLGEIARDPQEPDRVRDAALRSLRG